jgi:hypothetical protein
LILEIKLKVEIVIFGVARGASLWKTIENELKVQDFIDLNTAVNLGSMLGAQYLLEGKLIDLRVDQRENRSANGQVTGITYNGLAEASLNLT